MRMCDRLTIPVMRLKLSLAVALGVALFINAFSAASAQSDVYLPVVSFRDLTCAMPEPQPEATPMSDSFGTATSQVTNANSILPLGMQLDDVGQYYSQVAPSLSSAVIVSSTAEVSQTYSLELFGDTGYRIRTYNECHLPAHTTHEWKTVDGEFAVSVVKSTDVVNVPAEETCGEVTEGQDEYGRLEPSLHGVYHAVVKGGDSAQWEVRVRTITDVAHPEIRTSVETEYRAVNETGSNVYVPGVLATRNTSNYWDTELVVQNVTGAPLDLVIEFCDADGKCFDNNLASLDAHERRIFLASHLMYEPTPGGLVERRGWYSAVVHALPTDVTSSEPQVAVNVNLFRQSVEPDRTRPQAENGSICLYSLTPAAPSDRFEYSVSAQSATKIRLYNPSNDIVDVQIEPDAHSEGAIDKSQLSIDPGETRTVSVRLNSTPEAAGTVAGYSLESHALDPSITANVLVDASSPIAVFAWDDAGPVLPISQPEGSNWYAPLVASSVTPFQWDNERNAGDEFVPSATYGLSETVARDHKLRPDWARRLNWYDASYYSVGYDRSYCNETFDSNTQVSFHIPLWRRLGPCGLKHPNDRTCLNSYLRLHELRNTLPSSCAGRPLFIANEPELSSQGFMTYHEIGRLIYILRDWPGQLFTPAFASYNYENPAWPPEGDPLCRQLAEESACPGAEGCELCVRDGVVDGKLDPYDVSLKGLEEYYSEEGRWAQGQSWKMDDTVEGLLLHFYNEYKDEFDDSHWRIPYLQRYRERALEAGWPIIVKEYGFGVWPNEFGESSGFTASSVANQVDDIRRFLQQHLGGVGDGAGELKKMFWYHTGCDTISKYWSLLCLFSEPAVVTEPVGRCWYDDAIADDQGERNCGQDQPTE